MSQLSTKRSRQFLALGGGLIVLSVIIIITTYGSGPYFPPPLIFTWPTLILGGAFVGYGVAGVASKGDLRTLRISLAVVVGILGWVLQIWITSVINPAVDLIRSIGNGYLTSLSVAVIVVILIEVSISRLSSQRS